MDSWSCGKRNSMLLTSDSKNIVSVRWSYPFPAPRRFAVRSRSRMPRRSQTSPRWRSMVKAANKATLSRWSMTTLIHPDSSSLRSPFLLLHAASYSSTSPLCKPTPFFPLWLYHSVRHSSVSLTPFLPFHVTLSVPIRQSYKYVYTPLLVFICLCIRIAWHTNISVFKSNRTLLYRPPPGRKPTIARGDMPTRLWANCWLAQRSRCGVYQLHLRIFDELGGWWNG